MGFSGISEQSRDEHRWPHKDKVIISFRNILEENDNIMQ